MSEVVSNFYKFAREQDPVQPINHTDGWCGCAIGEFIAVEYERVVSKWNDPEMETLLDDLGSENKKLFAALNDPDNEDQPQTYGDLANLIEQTR